MQAIIIFLLLTVNAYAGTAIVDRQTIEYDDELSGKTFTGTNLQGFTGKTVYASIFSKEVPDTLVFAEGTNSVTFVCCHLDNVAIPEGSVVINPNCGSQRRYMVQDDGLDWLVDENNNPIEPL